MALDGDYSLGPRSTEDGVQADVSKIELVLLLRREADAKRGQFADGLES